MRYFVAFLALTLGLALPADAQRYGPNAGGYGPQAVGGGTGGAFTIASAALSPLTFANASTYSGTVSVATGGAGTMTGQPAVTLSTTVTGCNTTNGADNGSFTVNAATFAVTSTAAISNASYKLCFSVALPGATNTPQGYAFTLTNTSASITITDIYLGPTAGTHAASFTKGGTGGAGSLSPTAISVPATGGTFTGTLSLSGANTGGFVLSSTSLPSNLQCAATCPSGSSYTDVSVVATPTSGTAFTQPMTLTGTGGGYNGIADAVTGPRFYVGLRAMSNAEATAATAKLANVSNISAASTCDIIVAANGGIGITANCSTGATDNGKAATTYCPSNTACSVVTLYNRGADAMCNPTQGTTAARPLLSTNPVGVQFNGSSQYLACGPTPAGTNYGVPTTYVGALYPLGSGNQTAGVPVNYMNVGSGQWNGYAISWSQSTFFISAQTNAGGSFTSSVSTSTIPVNASGAFAAVYTSSTARLAYVAGVAGTADATSMAPSCSGCNIALGAVQLNATNYFYNGIVQEFAIYSSALTGPQVSAICHNQYVYGWSATSC